MSMSSTEGSEAADAFNYKVDKASADLWCSSENERHWIRQRLALPAMIQRRASMVDGLPGRGSDVGQQERSSTNHMQQILQAGGLVHTLRFCLEIWWPA